MHFAENCPKLVFKIDQNLIKFASGSPLRGRWSRALPHWVEEYAGGVLLEFRASCILVVRIFRRKIRR